MATEIVRKGFVNKNGEKVQLFPAPHEHPISEVKGLNDVLAGLSDSFEALDNGKQDKLTFDETPTAGSTNPVTSDGIKAALANLTPYRMVDGEGEEECEIYLYGHDGALLKAPTIDLRIGSEQADVSAVSLANLKRAMVDPDSTPTADSDNLVTSGGVKAALDDKAPANYVPYKIEKTTSEGTSRVLVDGEEIEFFIEDVTGDDPREVTAALNFSKMPNFARALRNPDTTPTANSDNLVTSGGVKAALDGKAPAGDTEVVFAEGEDITMYLPNYFTNGERQRSFILNYQGEATDLGNLFMVDPNDTIRILSDETINVGSCYFALRVIKQPGGIAYGNVYYIIFDGKVEY